MSDSVLCVIPAKGTSNRIPRKNLYKIAGKPLLVYTIEQAKLGISKPENIVVSSEDDEILDLAESYGVTPHRRPESLCGALSSTEAAMIDAYESRSDFLRKRIKSMLVLQPTSPIRLRRVISDCIKVFHDGDYDSLLTVTKFYNFLWYQRDEDGQLVWDSTYDPANRPMSQELGPEDYRYFDNGNIYMTKIEFLLREKSRLGGKVCPVPISEIESLQIDDPEEMKIVEAIFTGRLRDMM